MKNPTPEQAVLARFNDFTICIKMLLDAKHTLPALVLLYSAIDVFASLLRPESRSDTNGGYFKKWAEDYMLGPSQFTITSEDLWGARCGLLHAHSPSSRNSREGKARALAYYRVHSPTQDMKRQLDSALKLAQAKGQTPVDVDSLFASFENGIFRFLADMQRDPQLNKRAVHHSSKLVGVLTYAT